MRHGLLLSLLSLLSLLPGCTLVPIADVGPCAAVTNARGCQEKPYIINPENESTARVDSSQKAGTGR